MKQLTRTLRQYIAVLSKPSQTLQPEYPSPKQGFEPTDVVYRIPCGDCNWLYIGKTGRAFEQGQTDI